MTSPVQVRSYKIVIDFDLDLLRLHTLELPQPKINCDTRDRLVDPGHWMSLDNTSVSVNRLVRQPTTTNQQLTYCLFPNFHPCLISIIVNGLRVNNRKNVPPQYKFRFEIVGSLLTFQ